MTPADPPIADGLRWLRSQPLPDQTYDISMMIMALAAAKDSRDDGKLRDLADLLEDSQLPTGGWGYSGGGGNWWDNSNTQFAVLGLREAAHAGVIIDRQVLERARRHWINEQTGSVDAAAGAGWNYRGRVGGNVSGSMTVAGIASMTVLEELLHDDSLDTDRDHKILCCLDLDPSEGEQSIEAGIRWIERNFTVRTNPGENNWVLYYLYGLERAGRFTGTRFFGDHDWYREGADFLVAGQNRADGTWRSASEADPVVATSLALLFLSKGIAPVLINKIEFGPRVGRQNAVDDAVWNIHPRDAANLTEFVSTRDQWPHTLNWQSFDLPTASVEADGLNEALQAPVMYLAGRGDDLRHIYNDANQIKLLTDAIQQGGFLFAVASCDGENEGTEFLDGMITLVEHMFPDGEYQLRKLPESHDIYRSEFVFGANPPELYGVDFGCRTAIVVALEPHGCRWNKWLRVDPLGRHQDVTTTIQLSLRLAVNVIAYATGRELHDRLETPEILGQLDADHIAQGRLAIARLRHTGGWDAAPNAHRHLLLALQTTLGLQPSVEAPTIPATDPELFDYPIVYMHGRKNYQLTAEELEKLREYLQNGGVLIADACCGAPQFDESFRAMVEVLLDQPLARIPIDHEIYNHPVGHDIRQVQRRIPSQDAQSAITVEESIGEPILEGVAIDGRYVILYSKYDLSCALEQQATSACAGYDSADAARIAVNLVVYALFQ